VSASLTLAPPHPWAAGTTVSLYKGFARTSGAPSGSPVATAVVNASDLTLTFTGLEDGTSYVAYAAGQYVAISSPAAQAPQPAVIVDSLIAASVAAGIEAAIVSATAANTKRGRIEFTGGKVYALDRPVLIDRNLLGLTIDHQGAVLQLSSAAPRAYDWNKVADYDTFQNVTFLNTVVDVNNIGGRHHCLIGPWQNGSWQRKINLLNIHVLNTEIRNAPLGTDPNVDFRIGVSLSMSASPATDSQCTAKRSSVERIWSDGCLQLVNVQGAPVGAEATANTFHDDITVEDVQHPLPTTPTAFNAGAHVMCGTKGKGGTLTIRNVVGTNSPDVGVEYDGWQNVTLDNIDIEDAYDACFYHANFNPPADVEAQIATHTNCVARRRNLNDHGQGFLIIVPGFRSVTGVAATDIFTSLNPQDLTPMAHNFANGDQVVFSNLTGGAGLTAGIAYFVISATTNTFQVSTTSGGAALNFTTDLTVGSVTPLKYRPGSFHFGDGCFYHRMNTSAGFTVQNEGGDILGPRRVTGELHGVFEYPDFDSTGASVNPSGFRVRGLATTARTDPRLKFYARVIGTRIGAGTGFINWRTLILRDGLLSNFDIEVLSDVRFTNAGNATVIHADLGATVGSALLSGILKVAVPDNGGGGGNVPVGVQFESAAFNAVPTVNEEILLKDCNFVGLATGSTNVNFTGGSTLQSKVRFSNVVYRVWPRPSVAMSGANFAAAAFTTATGNQYIGNAPADIHFATGTGAAITLIEASKDGTTYEQVYAQASGVMATNVLVPVDHGDFIRVTFATTQPTTRVRFKKA
jgi:hypothetical protein